MKFVILSENLYKIKISSDKYICYNTLFGNPLLCSEKHIKLLEKFKDPVNLDDLNDKILKENIEIIKLFIEKKFLIEKTSNERDELKNIRKKYEDRIKSEMPFTGLGFFLTERCNLNCNYCVVNNYRNNDYIKKKHRSLKFNNKIKNIIDKFYKENLNIGRSKVEIGFTGGEPLLEWETLRNITEYIHENYRGIKTNFLLNTNLLLIDKNKINFLKHYNFSIAPSLDGIGSYNDTIRHFKNGTGTFKQIKDKLEMCIRNNLKIDVLSMTLTDENLFMEPTLILDFCKKHGVKTLRIEPDLLKPLSFPPEVVVDKLISYEKTARYYNITISGYWKDPFLRLLFSKDITKRIAFCLPFLGKVVSINPDESITICAYSKKKIANFESFESLWLSSRYVEILKDNWIGNIDECINCPIEGFCIGNCYVIRESNLSEKNNDAFLYRCEIQKLATYSLLNYYFKEE